MAGEDKGDISSLPKAEPPEIKDFRARRGSLGGYEKRLDTLPPSTKDEEPDSDEEGWEHIVDHETADPDELGYQRKKMPAATAPVAAKPPRTEVEEENAEEKPNPVDEMLKTLSEGPVGEALAGVLVNAEPIFGVHKCAARSPNCKHTTRETSKMFDYWKCKRCNNFEMCDACYTTHMASGSDSIHDQDHKFVFNNNTSLALKGVLAVVILLIVLFLFL